MSVKWSSRLSTSATATLSLRSASCQSAGDSTACGSAAFHSPAGNRQFNFGGRYSSGEGVCVPDARHVHRAHSVGHKPPLILRLSGGMRGRRRERGGKRSRGGRRRMPRRAARFLEAQRWRKLQDACVLRAGAAT